MKISAEGFDYDKKGDIEGLRYNVLLKFGYDYDGKITVENEGDLTKTTLVKCDFYTLEKWDVAGKYKFTMDKPFMNVSVINGEGKINGSKITKGDHFIIPSGIGECKISGDLTVMASYL